MLWAIVELLRLGSNWIFYNLSSIVRRTRESSRMLSSYSSAAAPRSRESCRCSVGGSFVLSRREESLTETFLRAWSACRDDAS